MNVHVTGDPNPAMTEKALSLVQVSASRFMHLRPRRSAVSEIVFELVGRPASLHRCEAARELGLDLFGATLTLGSIRVDLGELELQPVDHAVPTLDHGVVICTSS